MWHSKTTQKKTSKKYKKNGPILLISYGEPNKTYLYRTTESDSRESHTPKKKRNLPGCGGLRTGAGRGAGRGAARGAGLPAQVVQTIQN